jgi:hypothetical protein
MNGNFKGEGLHSFPRALLCRSGYAKAQGEGWEGGLILFFTGFSFKKHPVT